MLNIKNMDGKTRIIVLAVAFALVMGLFTQMTGNVSKSYIDKGHYFSPAGESQCDKVGGTAVSIGDQGKVIYGKKVRLHSIGEDVSLVSVDGAKRGMEPGMEKYIAGVYVTVFSTGTNDACLIVKDWQ